MLAIISLIHYSMGGAAGMLHGILGHLSIIPIILVAYWYGIKGGVIVTIEFAMRGRSPSGDR